MKPKQAPISRCRLEYAPRYLMHFEEVMEQVRNHGVSAPLPVVKRGHTFYVKGSEETFLAAKQAKLREIPYLLIEDERGFDRFYIGHELRPRENPIDLSGRIEAYRQRWGLVQTELAADLGCSQALLSYHRSIQTLLYSEARQHYKESIRIMDATRHQGVWKGKARRRRGTDRIGLKHLYQLTRIHSKVSDLPSSVAKRLQLTFMKSICRACPSVTRLTQEVKLRVKEAHGNRGGEAEVVPTDVKVYHADGRYLLSAPCLGPETIDLVVTSPPFATKKFYEQHITSLDEHLENIIPPLQCAAISLKPSGMLFFEFMDYMIDGPAYFPIKDLLAYALMECGMKFENMAVRNKLWKVATSPRNQRRRHTEYRFYQDFDYLLCFRKGEVGRREIDFEQSEMHKEFFRDDAEGDDFTDGFSSVLRFGSAIKKRGNSDATSARMNPQLLRFLIGAFSFERDRVLDPFAGTGSTGEIAAKMNRSCVMFENNPRQIEALGSLVVRESVPKSEPNLPTGWKSIWAEIKAAVPTGARKSYPRLKDTG